MAPGVAIGVESDLARGEHTALDGVDLADELAVARERHVATLKQDLEVRRPALLRLVGEILADNRSRASSTRSIAGMRRVLGSSWRAS
ncbi:hypothetical protein [Polyangium mundeleinium]|uniref:Uncharacterized protein n=1 Tax=Polyangium mundeleinium TaxID=2995306 RepID=A0ABT5EGE4_9BACT|nr:hypothetical protein [Polyangium mundeleinium]MDC0740895.1 hypothetical protein [Polyangium mundeleinium]